MGNSRSSSIANAPYDYFKEEFAMLKMSKPDLFTLFYIFQKLQPNDQGLITMDALSIYFDHNCTMLLYRIFNLLNNHDNNDDPSIDFKHFVYYLWNFCTLSYQNLVYDYDSSGYLSLIEAISLIGDIRNDKSNQSTGSNTVDRDIARELCSGQINIISFQDIIKENPILLSSIVKLQVTLRNLTLGRDVWMQYCYYRVDICNENFNEIIIFLSRQLVSKVMFTDCNNSEYGSSTPSPCITPLRTSITSTTTTTTTSMTSPYRSPLKRIPTMHPNYSKKKNKNTQRRNTLLTDVFSRFSTTSTTASTVVSTSSLKTTSTIKNNNHNKNVMITNSYHKPSPSSSPLPPPPPVIRLHRIRSRSVNGELNLFTAATNTTTTTTTANNNNTTEVNDLPSFGMTSSNNITSKSRRSYPFRIATAVSSTRSK